MEKSKNWFIEAGFGLFVHWGLYSMPGGVWKGEEYSFLTEWIMNNAKIPMKEYELLSKQFNPTLFDASEWVRLAENAGMKYIVFTAKHHDGFAMFRSECDQFNIFDSTPFKRDPLQELADACSKSSCVKLCLYYSQAQDWRDGNAGNGPQDGGYGNHWDFPQGSGSPEGFEDYLNSKSIPQIRELLTNYGPISMIWFDNPLPCFTRKHAEKVKEVVRSLQPSCLISARIGHGLGDVVGFGDNVLPDALQSLPNESCVTMNDSWGFDKRSFCAWKSPEELMEIRKSCIEKKCNLLLNIGPMPDGRFPPEAIERLEFFTKHPL